MVKNAHDAYFHYIFDTKQNATNYTYRARNTLSSSILAHTTWSVTLSLWVLSTNYLRHFQALASFAKYTEFQPKLQSSGESGIDLPSIFRLKLPQN